MPRSSSVFPEGKAERTERASDEQRKLLHSVVHEEHVVMCRLGMSSLGQSYCLLLKRVKSVAFQVFLVTYEERRKPEINRPVPISTVTPSYEKSKDIMDEFESRVNRDIIDMADLPDYFTLTANRDLYVLSPLPSWAHQFPETQLEIGDEIFVDCKSILSFYHTGIYAGNDQVYHFTCHYDGESSIGAALNCINTLPGMIQLDSWNKFLMMFAQEGRIPQIFRASHILKMRRPDEVIQWADMLRLSLDAFRVYDLRDRNCQHFSSLCSTGIAFSYDMLTQWKFAACSLVKSSLMLFDNNKSGSQASTPTVNRGPIPYYFDTDEEPSSRRKARISTLFRKYNRADEQQD